MRENITKIHKIKRSRNGNAFIRVTFKLENGSWAKTDLCPDYRNYQRWVPFLIEGLDLNGLVMKSPSEVDADSYPNKISQKVDGQWVRNSDGTMSFINNPIPDESEIIDSAGMEQQKLL